MPGSLVVTLDKDGIPTAHLYIERQGDTPFDLPAPVHNVVTGLRLEKPLQAIGNKVVEGVYVLHIGGHRPMYVVIAKGVAGLVNLTELLPRPLSTSVTTALMQHCINLSKGGSSTQPIQGDHHPAFEAISAQMDKVNRSNGSYYLAFDLTKLPDPTQLAVDDQPSTSEVVVAGSCTQ